MGDAARIEVIVFDFDGTLIDSNGPKHRAFYDLFPDREEYRTVIHAVLEECGEESRYVILERILARLQGNGRGLPGVRVEELAERYNALALSAAGTCSEKPGASAALSELGGRYSLYLSSGTPVDPLRTLVAARGWTRHFRDIFGYPARKDETLRTVMQRESYPEARILVVGDGHSDRSSAETTGCSFFPAMGDDALSRLLKVLH